MCVYVCLRMGVRVRLKRKGKDNNHMMNKFRHCGVYKITQKKEREVSLGKILHLVPNSSQRTGPCLSFIKTETSTVSETVSVSVMHYLLLPI